MSSRRKQRNTSRQPVEELLRHELQSVASSKATIRIEVHDRDGIRGGVIWVDLLSSMAQDDLIDLGSQLATLAKSNIPANHPLATWSMVFRFAGKDVKVTHWLEV